MAKKPSPIPTKSPATMSLMIKPTPMPRKIPAGIKRPLRSSFLFFMMFGIKFKASVAFFALAMKGVEGGGFHDRCRGMTSHNL